MSIENKSEIAASRAQTVKELLDGGAEYVIEITERFLRKPKYSERLAITAEQRTKIRNVGNEEFKAAVEKQLDAMLIEQREELSQEGNMFTDDEWNIFKVSARERMRETAEQIVINAKKVKK